MKENLADAPATDISKHAHHRRLDLLVVIAAGRTCTSHAAGLFDIVMARQNSPLISMVQSSALSSQIKTLNHVHTLYNKHQTQEPQRLGGWDG